MALFKDKFQELEENNDIQGMIELLNSNEWQNRYKAVLSLINMGDSTAILEVEKLVDDPHLSLRRAARTYLRINNAYSKTRPDDIKMYPYDIKNSHNRIQKITIHSKDIIHAKSSIKEEINQKLKENASNLGANALIDVKYYEGLSNFFRGTKVQGTAVFIKDISEEIHPKLKSTFVLGLLQIALAVLWYLDYLEDLDVFELYGSCMFLILGIFFLFTEIFNKRGYRNKTYFLGYFIVIITNLLLGRSYLNKYGLNNVNFIIILLLLVFLLIFLQDYRKRESNPKTPWKGEWGF